MTSIVFDLRNFATVSKFKAHFHTNQQVSITYNSDSITATSLQSGSTPGVFVADTHIFEPKTTYEFLVLGRSAANVILWAEDRSNNVSLNDGISRLTNDNNANHMFITNRTDKKIKVKLGILFEKPAELGDQFTLEAAALIKREGLVTGLWRQFEHEDLIVRDKYSQAEQQWMPTVTFTNGD